MGAKGRSIVIRIGIFACGWLLFIGSVTQFAHAESAVPDEDTLQRSWEAIFGPEIARCERAGGKSFLQYPKTKEDRTPFLLECRCNGTTFNDRTHRCVDGAIVEGPAPQPLPGPDDDEDVIPSGTVCQAYAPELRCSMGSAVRSWDIVVTADAGRPIGDYCEYSVSFALTASCRLDISGEQELCPAGCHNRKDPRVTCLLDLDDWGDLSWTNLYFGTDEFGTGTKLTLPDTGKFQARGGCRALTKSDKLSLMRSLTEGRTEEFERLALQRICAPAFETLGQLQQPAVSWVSDFPISCGDGERL